MTKAGRIFEDCISEDFISMRKMKSSEYVNYCWNKYKEFSKRKPQNNNTNGNVFELIVESELYRRSLCPMYLQAKVAFVPNVKFDVLLYSSEQFPIGVSIKTSLRERYKQADLEAIALKYVHRKALNYLVTLDIYEANNAKKKLERGELLGIDRIVIATNEDFDMMFDELMQMSFIQPGKIDIITAGNIVTK